MKTDEHVHSVGHCYRCHTVIEPWLSDQWFVDMKPLAAAGDRGRARRARDLPPEALGERVLPLDGEHPRLVHLAPAVVGPPHPGVLLRRVRASGRLDGGPHRVPDVRRRRFARTRTSSTRGSARSCGRSPRSAGRSRRPSSEYFYPTSVLSTARDILFLWVARMIMSGMYFNDGEIPFADVIIHPRCSTPRAGA